MEFSRDQGSTSWWGEHPSRDLDSVPGTGQYTCPSPRKCWCLALRKSGKVQSDDEELDAHILNGWYRISA